MTARSSATRPRRRAVLTGLSAAGVASQLRLAPAAAAERQAVRVAYVGLAEDPRYEPRRAYTGLRLRDRRRPLEGVELGLRDARVPLRRLGLTLELDTRLVAGPDEAALAAEESLAGGAIAVLLDLPPQAVRAVVERAGGNGLLLDLRTEGTDWRRARCGPGHLFVAPSRQMLADALAQYLRFRGWERVLLLAGGGPGDMANAQAARQAIGKFGLTLAAERAFELTSDPTRRESSNVALLTGGVRHDVIWLIDGDGEYGRYVPYATYAPRPVVGSTGLRPLAWHWTFERYGAPQLNQRFERRIGHRMGEEGWIGWAGVKVLVQAMQDTGGANPATVATWLVNDDHRVDLYKGYPGSFRSWNGQLRQSVLLATHDAVIALAPLEGFEHRVNVLDTLGLDRSEVECPGPSL